MLHDSGQSWCCKWLIRLWILRVPRLKSGHSVPPNRLWDRVSQRPLPMTSVSDTGCGPEWIDEASSR
jgi:hypothetical protein